MVSYAIFRLARKVRLPKETQKVRPLKSLLSECLETQVSVEMVAMNIYCVEGKGFSLASLPKGRITVTASLEVLHSHAPFLNELDK